MGVWGHAPWRIFTNWMPASTCTFWRWCELQKYKFQNEDMIVAVVIAIFWTFLGGYLQLVKLEFPLWRSYVHFYVHCTFCLSILGMKTFLLDGWHKPKLNSQNNADVKLMHVWRVIEGQQSMYTKQWPVLLLFYRTPANVSNYFSKRPWYSLSQEC